MDFGRAKAGGSGEGFAAGSLGAVRLRNFLYGHGLFIFFPDSAKDFPCLFTMKISSVAGQAGLNPGLVRQYASGVKYPSAAQAGKIRNAVKKIARQLLADSIYPT